MAIVFWWLPNLFAAAALLICAVQGWRRRSLGLVLLGIYFAHELGMSIFIAVRQHQRNAEYLRTFVREQTGPNTWTAPVAHVNYSLTAPLVQGLLLLAVILIARRLAPPAVADSWDGEVAARVP